MWGSITEHTSGCKMCAGLTPFLCFISVKVCLLPASMAGRLMWVMVGALPSLVTQEAKFIPLPQFVMVTADILPM